MPALMRSLSVTLALLASPIGRALYVPRRAASRVVRGAADRADQEASPESEGVRDLQREVFGHVSEHLNRMNAVKAGSFNMLDDGYAERGSVGSSNGAIPDRMAWGTSRERKQQMVASLEASAARYYDEAEDAVVVPTEAGELPLATLLTATAHAAKAGVAEEGIGSSSRDRDGTWTDNHARQALLDALDALDEHATTTQQYDEQLSAASGSFLSWMAASPAPLQVPLDVPGAPPNAKVWICSIPPGVALNPRPSPPGAVGFTKVLFGDCTAVSGIGSLDRRREIHRKALSAPSPAWQAMGGPWRQLVNGVFPDARTGPPGVIGRKPDNQEDPADKPAAAEGASDWKPNSFVSAKQIKAEAADAAERAAQATVLLHVQLTPPNRDYPVAVGGSFCSDTLSTTERTGHGAAAASAAAALGEERRPTDPNCTLASVLPGLSAIAVATMFTATPPPAPRTPPAPQDKGMSMSTGTGVGSGTGMAGSPEGKKTYSIRFSSADPTSFFASKPSATSSSPADASGSAAPAAAGAGAQEPLQPARNGGRGSFGALADPEALALVGGLDEQIKTIARRILASRRLAAGQANALGLAHVRGMLLHGPPGCGKTLLARQLAQALDAAECQVVSGPEVLNKFVGTSEERVRQLFARAEQDWRLRGAASGLHVVILDELDAICRQRGSLGGDTSGVRDSVVNQLLAKLDGVTELGNILVVGLTNQRALIDDAMLRPGRLEVHVYVGKPDTAGRLAILNIHTTKLRSEGCITAAALDFLPEAAERTEGLSGADIAGVVRMAGSFALERFFDAAENGAAGADHSQPLQAQILVDAADFQRALDEWQQQKDLEAEEEKALRQGRLMGEHEPPSLEVDHGAVKSFLDGVGLGQYAALFEEQQIGPDEFPSLEHDMLQQMGVTLLGHRLRILSAIPRRTNPYATTRRK